MNLQKEKWSYISHCLIISKAYSGSYLNKIVYRKINIAISIQSSNFVSWSKKKSWFFFKISNKLFLKQVYFPSLMLFNVDLIWDNILGRHFLCASCNSDWWILLFIPKMYPLNLSVRKSDSSSVHLFSLLLQCCNPENWQG